ncbi:unnamed protein product [Cladocopium goreaui]|uniref:Probable inorganic carbon transporter subunit DabA 1 n=1 Tax=Cladocopium goreaui TaxID=2562237 RepID=A0A9P1BEW5_9DINO|nr:unnamed protein product [Cladocopium goreaui]
MADLVQVPGRVNHEGAANLQEMLNDVRETIAPLWPLRDFVAVNPFVGMSKHTFLDARAELRRVRNAEMMMPAGHYLRLFESGQIDAEDVEQAVDQCKEAYPEQYQSICSEEVFSWLENDSSSGPFWDDEFRLKTMAETIDCARSSDWSSTIVDSISRFCAAHYDQGQSIWPSPWKGLSLYSAWHEAAQLDRRVEKLGLNGFRETVSQLPSDPLAAIEHLLKKLGVPSEQRYEFCLSQLYSVSGWAAYAKYRDEQNAASPGDDLIGLLAIRLAFDAALKKLTGFVIKWQTRDASSELSAPHWDQSRQLSRDVLYRYLLMVASEIHYREQLCSAIEKNQSTDAEVCGRKTAQMVFCIDVRSERMRRHLEAITDDIETFGFAGFFGMPIEHIPLGEANGTAQCPVLIRPGFAAREGLGPDETGSQVQLVSSRRKTRLFKKMWKSFQTSCSSCFSFVESFGLAYAYHLLLDSVGLSRERGGRYDGVPRHLRSKLAPELSDLGGESLSVQTRIELAHNMLKGLGLTSNFAKLVVLCGHECKTTNNPFNAAFDCGACGGHSGEPNARVAASLLNDQEVREGLRYEGIEIPSDVWFVAAVHNTTTDEISICDEHLIPEQLATECENLNEWIAESRTGTCGERGPLLGATDEYELAKKSNDWSEVRPEWGLAGNAAFVVAPRSRTAGLNLDGRVFMHSYDFRRDPEAQVLESIMTAPMIVTNWINLQYYASSVDNQAFGSGNKVLHNVVGKLGVLEGNGGDLRTGLTMQSVHTGADYQHEPLRLLVVIEASRQAISGVIEKHENVCNLVTNGWLNLVSIDDDRFYRYAVDGTWIELGQPVAAPVYLEEETAHRFGDSASPRALWILCSEPCMDPVAEALCQNGMAYPLRWPGNCPRDAEVAEKTLEYAVEELGVVEIVVCGHSLCNEVPGGADIVSGTHQGERLSLVERAHRGQRLTQLAKNNVIEQVAAIQSQFSSALAEEKPSVKVHGLFYLTESRLFLSLDQGEFVPLRKSSHTKEAGCACSE